MEEEILCISQKCACTPTEENVHTTVGHERTGNWACIRIHLLLNMCTLTIEHVYTYSAWNRKIAERRKNIIKFSTSLEKKWCALHWGIMIMIRSCTVEWFWPIWCTWWKEAVKWFTCAKKQMFFKFLIIVKEWRSKRRKCPGVLKVARKHLEVLTQRITKDRSLQIWGFQCKSSIIKQLFRMKVQMHKTTNYFWTLLA